MRLHDLDLNLLVALDVMLRLRSISRAAEQMHITQSAMSNALSRLRGYFEDPLLVAVGRHMEPTSRAEALMGPLRDIIIRIDSAVLARPDFDPMQSTREYRLLLSDYSVAVLIPNLTASLAARGPGVRLRLLPQTEAPHLLLERGEADFLIAPRYLCSTIHPMESLFFDPLCCIAWKENPIASAPLTREAFEQARHVVMQPPGHGSTYDALIYAKAGIVRNVAATTFTFTGLPALVVGTPLLATVHERLARSAARYLPIAILDPPIEIPPLEQMVQWHEYRSNDPALNWLRCELARAATIKPSRTPSNRCPKPLAATKRRH